MNTVIKFPTPSAPQTDREEVRVADCDDGYTRLANDLLDALIAADLTMRQYKVALAVIRKTYGFNKTMDWVTNEQISDATGIPATRVSTAKNELLRMGVLVGVGRKIGPNKVLSEWKTDIPQNGETFPKKGNVSFPKRGNSLSPKRGDTKDIIQKTVKTIKPSSSQNAFASNDDDSHGDKKTIHPDAAVQTEKGNAWGTAGDLSCAEYIYRKVLVVAPTAKAPNWAQWANDIRLMRVQDGRTHREICELFKWANQDTFWSANVLCPKTLRKQWDKLAAKRSGATAKPGRAEPPMPKPFGESSPAKPTATEPAFRPRPFGE